MAAESTPAHSETPASATRRARWRRWLVLSPLARIVIFVALAGAMIFLLQLAFRGLGWTGKAAPVPQRQVGMFLMQVAPALLAYLFVVRFVERRVPAEIAWRKVLWHGPAGALAGMLLMAAVVGVLWLAGSYEVTGTRPDPPWVRQLLVGGLGAAIAEEVMVRGVLFRIAEEGLGTWAALAISALLFGFGHIANPGATVWSSVAIAVEAGLLLGLLFHVFRSLPLCIGVHMGWNFSQGTLWGIPVSGGNDTGWLVSARSGPDWLSGGSFGAEASVVSVATCSLLSIALLVAALRRRSIVPPWFARGPAPAARGPQAADNATVKATPSC